MPASGSSKSGWDVYRDGKDSRLTTLGRDILAEFVRIDLALRNIREHFENSVFSQQACSMEQRATGLLTGAAGLGTDTAVLMHAGMALAFCRADAASLRAGHQLCLDQHRTRLREA